MRPLPQPWLKFESYRVVMIDLPKFGSIAPEYSPLGSGFSGSP